MNQKKKPRSKKKTFPEDRKHRVDYRRIWKLVVFLTAGVSLIPLIFITVIDYQVTQNAIESEFLLRTTRVVSNCGRVISFFLEERKSALNFIIHDNDLEAFENPRRLANILENLQKSFGGGFTDLGLVNSSGYQSNYVGPYPLKGKRYGKQEWYKQVVEHGTYISDVFLGYRRAPHFVIAVKRTMPDGSFHILRAAISISLFEALLSNLELEGLGNAFMINHEGTLQTISRYYGNVLSTLPLSVPKFSDTSQVYEGENIMGHKLVIGYRFIDDSPFILMIVKNKRALMKSWLQTRLKLIAFLIGSITVILTVILWTSGYMLKKIKIADEKRLMSLHQVEYSNKMASIGRMAANVAHEINNPLAIINEKAGLIKDLFVFKGEYAKDEKLMGLVDSILSSVKRAGTITKRLLTFTRKFESSLEKIDPGKLLGEVLSFFQREAEHRDISLNLNVSENTPGIESDRGRLQQLFVNIINNAFAAIDDGGRIDISVGLKNQHQIFILFADDGCGIDKKDLNRIFEPFFSTKTGSGGTGLGLSITYNLIQEIGGEISADSELGKGTTFKVTLPLKMK